MIIRIYLILILLGACKLNVNAQNSMVETYVTDIPSYFEGYDPLCDATLTFILPDGPNYDIQKINFEYAFVAKNAYAPVTQESQLYFENLDKESPIYSGTKIENGSTEYYSFTDFTSFNGSFCGGDTLTFRLRLWRTDGAEACSYDQYVASNTFSIELFYSDVYADRITVGSDIKNSILEVKGSLKIGNIPEISEEGMMVYDSTANDFLGYNGTSWKSLLSPDEISDQDNDTKITVEDTPDEDVVKMYVAGTPYFSFEEGRINVLNNGHSVFLGNMAGQNETSGNLENVAIGDSALVDNTNKGRNVAIGFKSLKVNGTNSILPNDGTDNTAVGHESMMSNTRGADNTAVGNSTLSSNTIGNFNVAVGSNVLSLNTTGYSNVGFGFTTLSKNEIGHNNVGIGRGSLNFNTDGNENASMGSFSLNKNISGNQNIAIGGYALQKSEVQSENVAIGYGALQNNGDGVSDVNLGIRNTAVGHQSQNAAINGNNNTSLGYLSLTNNTAYQNTAIGSGALENNAAAFDNTAVGFEAINANTSGTRNTALGSKALKNAAASNNTAIGSESLMTLTSGSNNTAVGNRSMANGNNAEYTTAIGSISLLENSGNYNTGIGYGALAINSSGFENTYGGANSGAANTTGSRNVAFGYRALFNNIDEDELTAIGYKSLESNTSGIGNTGVGYSALRDNQTGDYNTSVGHASQLVNVGSKNTSLGYHSLTDNTSGYENTSIGYNALQSNTNGFRNVSIGSLSMENNTAAFSNVAIGHSALQNLTSGEGNIAIGQGAFNTTGFTDVCTSIGYLAGGGHGNSMALGYSAALTAANQVRIGNSFISSIGGYAAWTNVSDGRFKKDVSEDVPGLAFIRKLKPVTYTYDYDAIKQFHNEKGMPYPDQNKFNLVSEENTLSGFIAQDVKTAAEELGYDFSGVDNPEGGNDFYGLRYATFVVPVVKSIQEVDNKIEDQQKLIDLLIQQNEALTQRIQQLENILGNE